VAIDPAGNFLLVTNSGSGTVSVYTISANSGELSAIDGSPFAAGLLPSGIAISTAGQGRLRSLLTREEI
jgi:DNA-binding beta-propeller fold protein YncE